VLSLPVAGVAVQLQLPRGADDIALLEAGTPSVEVAVTLLANIVRRYDGLPLDWPTLAMTDIDVLLLSLRQQVIGDRLSAEVVCQADACGERVDIVLSIADYVEHHRPRPPARVAAVDQTWFRLDGLDVEFRVPSVADQLAIASEERSEQALARRCMRPPETSSRARRRVETAMEALAPSLASELTGSCPECGAAVSAWFDPLQYVLRELREQAEFVYDDVCAIARLTHWSETDILALPAARRARYAELAQSAMAYAR
jgi:hypothetical protein